MMNPVQESDYSTEGTKRKFIFGKFQIDENRMFWLREELRGESKPEVGEDKDKTLTVTMNSFFSKYLFLLSVIVCIHTNFIKFIITITPYFNIHYYN